LSRRPRSASSRPGTNPGDLTDSPNYHHLRPIAKTFGLSQTATQLRLAEVLGDERAVVTANHANVLVRGRGWGSVPVLRIAAGQARRPDVAKVTLRGGIDEGRVALRRRG